MSLRARASGPDEWLRVKVTKKNGSGASEMLTGYSGWRATSGCGSIIVLLANPEGMNTFLLSASEGAFGIPFLCVL